MPGQAKLHCVQSPKKPRPLQGLGLEGGRPNTKSCGRSRWKGDASPGQCIPVNLNKLRESLFPPRSHSCTGDEEFRVQPYGATVLGTSVRLGTSVLTLFSNGLSRPRASESLQPQRCATRSTREPRDYCRKQERTKLKVGQRPWSGNLFVAPPSAKLTNSFLERVMSRSPPAAPIQKWVHPATNLTSTLWGLNLFLSPPLRPLPPDAKLRVRWPGGVGNNNPDRPWTRSLPTLLDGGGWVGGKRERHQNPGS